MKISKKIIKKNINWIKNIGIFSVVFITSLKLIDIGFGIISKNSPSDTLSRFNHRSLSVREFDPNQSAVIVPNINYLSSTDSLDDKEYIVNIDNDGFISNGNSRISAKPDHTILFLGGSTTECLWVSQKNRFPSVVERKLNDAGLSVKVFNGGVSGNNSLHSLVKFLAKGIPMKPSYVVMMHNINDFAVLAKLKSYWQANPERSLYYYPNQKDAGLFGFLRKVKNFLVPNLWAYLAPRLITPKVGEFDGISTDQEMNVDSISSSFRSSLNSFIHTARSWNIEPVLMTQFNRFNSKDQLFNEWYKKQEDYIGINKSEFLSAYDHLNDITREVAIKLKVPLIDLAEKVPSESKYLYDSVHLNEQGAVLVGKIISEFFVNKINVESN